jgi:hypothetical protein
MGRFGSGFGLEFCAAIVHEEWLRAGVCFVLMCVLAAMALYSKDAKAWLAATNPNYVAPAFMLLLLGIILWPFIEQHKWLPFSSNCSSNNERTFDYSTNDGRITVSIGGSMFVLRFSKRDKNSIYLYKDGTNLVSIARVKSSQPGRIDDYDTSSRVYAIGLGEAFLAENNEGAVLAARVIDLKDDSSGDDRDEVRFTYELSRNRK